MIEGQGFEGLLGDGRRAGFLLVIMPVNHIAGGGVVEQDDGHWSWRVSLVLFFHDGFLIRKRGSASSDY